MYFFDYTFNDESCIIYSITYSIHYNYLSYIQKLDLSPELLESIINRRPLQNSLFDLVIHRNKLGHGFQHLIQQLFRNSHHAFQGVTEDNITLFC